MQYKDLRKFSTSKRIVDAFPAKDSYLSKKRKGIDVAIVTRGTDQNYLLNEQYKTSSNLTNRMSLHERFSTNPQEWMHWVFDQYDLPEDAKILELGCGPALLWRKNIDRIPGGWNIVLSDFSPGMIDEAKGHLESSGRAFRFEQVDAQEIPFEDDAFDAVIANHMLYHVPNQEKAFAEIQRVLKPGGQLFAATNGKGSMCELRELVARVVPDEFERFGDRFGLENGAEKLEPYFDAVEIRRQETGLQVTETDPLIDYIDSGRGLSDDQLNQLREIVDAEIREKGAVYITKDPGMFVAQKG